MTTPEELADTMSSLREQIQQARSQLLDAGVPAGLQSSLADSLDRLVEMSMKDPSSDNPFMEHLSSAVAESLKLWRTEFSHSVHQLNEVFPAIQGSLSTANQLREELSEQLKKIEQHRLELKEELQRTHALQSRFSRQRKALAQSIRAERAELQLKSVRLQLDLENRLTSEMQTEREKHQSEKSHFDSSLEAALTKISELSQTIRRLEDQEDQFEKSKKEIEDLRSRLAQSEQTARNAVGTGEYQKLQDDLQFANDQLSQATRQISKLQRQTEELHSQLEAKSEELQKSQSLLDEMESAQPPPSPHVAEIERENQKLHLEIEKVEAELSDLRRQNSELAAKIAQQTTDKASNRSSLGTASQELLTWEERKKMILQQLEMETDSSSTHSHEQRLEVQKIIQTTETEIARRDREIEELRAIVQTQSDAREGIAIGAAGVAQILDADELISAERQKLREIQQEWEAKLRQAEIDLSMERAKLARERAELEMQKSAMPAATAPGTTASGTDKHQRRWLDFLGLKEETTE